NLTDLGEMKAKLRKIEVPGMKSILTGSGKVAHGAKEMLDHLKIKQIEVTDYLTKHYREPVYCMIDVLDYNKRKDGQVPDKADFYNYPEHYVSDFMRFARASDMLITGHFYGNGAPFFFTKEDAKSPDFKINLIADISCDVGGPIASTIRSST